MSDTTIRPPSAGATGRTSGWATGLTIFASTIMIVVGICQALLGISALVHDEIHVSTPGYIYSFDITGWGWVHLLLGAVVALAGVAVIQRKTWGRLVGIVLASLSIFANFLFIPHYPVWSLLIIALDVAVIWALACQQQDVV
jgi:hypothetical protein